MTPRPWILYCLLIAPALVHATPLTPQSKPPAKPGKPTKPAKPPVKKLTLIDLPDNPLSGEVPIQLSADPVPRKPTTFYVICIDDTEVLRFKSAPASDWWDTTKHTDGRHVLTLERRDTATDKSFVAVTVDVEIVNVPP